MSAILYIELFQYTLKKYFGYFSSFVYIYSLLYINIGVGHLCRIPEFYLFLAFTKSGVCISSKSFSHI